MHVGGSKNSKGHQNHYYALCEIHCTYIKIKYNMDETKYVCNIYPHLLPFLICVPCLHCCAFQAEVLPARKDLPLKGGPLYLPSLNMIYLSYCGERLLSHLPNKNRLICFTTPLHFTLIGCSVFGIKTSYLI